MTFLQSFQREPFPSTQPYVPTNGGGDCHIRPTAARGKARAKAINMRSAIRDFPDSPEYGLDTSQRLGSVGVEPIFWSLPLHHNWAGRRGGSLREQQGSAMTSNEIVFLFVPVGSVFVDDINRFLAKFMRAKRRDG